MAGKLNMGFLAAIVVAVLLKTSAAQTTHVVGDALGWVIPPGGPSVYTNWAANQTFVVGDILVFNFMNGNHDVAEVTKADYDACATSNPISFAATGPARIPLNSTGEHYFFCNFTGHCSSGQKLMVNVSAAASSPSPQSSASPAPQPTTPPPVSTPSPTPVSAPSPVPPPAPTPSSSATPPTTSATTPATSATSPAPTGATPPTTSTATPPTSTTGPAPTGATPPTPSAPTPPTSTASPAPPGATPPAPSSATSLAATGLSAAFLSIFVAVF